jgi:copper homeostasis protein
VNLLRAADPASSEKRLRPERGAKSPSESERGWGSRALKKPDRTRPLIEVIVQTIDDARAAADGGADRLEVVRAIEDGGLTPSLSLVEVLATATPLPLRVMLRENRGFETTPGEMKSMQAAARELASMHVDGLVAGFARNGKLSLDEFDAVLSATTRVPVTFHRAFDSLVEPDRAIDVLAVHTQVDRILTSGGIGSAEERCARLGQYVARAGSRVTIIAGGGVDLRMFELLVEQGSVREIHLGRLARADGNPEGPISAASVRRLRDLADRPRAR